MSMPGFVFYFRCDCCDATSDDYSAYVFHDVFRPDIGLPAWSLTHKCWATVYAQLSFDQRREMESNRDVLLSFAASLSSDNFTVGVPLLSATQPGAFDVQVTPVPLCPYCGVPCQSVFGYPPRPTPSEVQMVSAAEFRAVPISMVELSVRAMMICRELGIQTLGQLEASRSQFAEHPRASNAVQEIDSLLSRKPADDPSRSG